YATKTTTDKRARSAADTGPGREACVGVRRPSCDCRVFRQGVWCARGSLRAFSAVWVGVCPDSRGSTIRESQDSGVKSDALPGGGRRAPAEVRRMSATIPLEAPSEPRRTTARARAPVTRTPTRAEARLR